MCRLSWNLGISTSWNRQGLSRHVMGLIYRLQCSHIGLLGIEPTHNSPSLCFGPVRFEFLVSVTMKLTHFLSYLMLETVCLSETAVHIFETMCRFVFWWPDGQYPYSEINPTRCNNCVFSSQWLYSTCFVWQFHPSSGVHMLYMASGRQVYLCCNFFSQYYGSLIVVGRVEL